MDTTCGGMGLTGIIVSAILKLKKKLIHQPYYKRLLSSINELFDCFENYNEDPFSVAWVFVLQKINQ